MSISHKMEILNIDQAFSYISQILYKKEIDIRSFIDVNNNIYTFYDASCSQNPGIENFDEDNLTKIKLSKIEIKYIPPTEFSTDSDNSHYIKIIENTEIIDQIQKEKITKESKEFLFIGILIRNLLISSKLNSGFINRMDTSEKIKEGFWYNDCNWLFLIITQHRYSFPIDNTPKGKFNIAKAINVASKDFMTKVYFNRYELDVIFQTPSKFKDMNHQDNLINIEMYHTPWLELMNVIFNEYGRNGKLQNVSKAAVESYITDLQSKGKFPDIAKSDIPNLVKFMRHAEQKKGSAFHSNTKNKSST